MTVALRGHFVYHKSVNAERTPEMGIARIAAAIGEPARVRILYSLLDGRARTSTELAVIGGVSPSTASVHLHRLETLNLVKVHRQGKHRYYTLEGPEVAGALEALDVVAGSPRAKFVPNTPPDLLLARSCYDHIAGRIGVQLRHRFQALGWLSAPRHRGSDNYDLTGEGNKALEKLGVDLAGARALRRRFAYPCLDWSERQPHIAGALGAALLHVALKRKWMLQELDSRALTLTRCGRSELRSRFGLDV